VAADLDEPVEVVAYDPSWPERFAAERERIAAALCGHDVAIEHVGGTAVPGLAARPVVDVMIGGTKREVVVPAGAGAAVHVVERGGRLWRDNLLVRDFLRSHERARERLGAIKRRAARDARGSLSRYSELKAPSMHALVAIARVRAWAAGRDDVRGLFLVGSHARGDARPDSDVDLVLLCDDPSPYVADAIWAEALDGEVIATRTWGMLTERRLRLDAVKPDVDLGIATPDWDRSATAPHICDLREGSDPFT
jgi:GrpB-like predicted nucleotidyltransferase (UPF0157 family)